MMPPPPFPDGIDYRSYWLRSHNYNYRLMHSVDGGSVSISHHDRDGNVVNEAEADWLSGLADGLDGVRRVLGSEWRIDGRESAILLERRLAEGAALRSRHVSIKNPKFAPKLIALLRPLAPAGYVSWTFTGLPGDPPSDYVQLVANASLGKIQLKATRYADRRSQDSAWLPPLVGTNAVPLPPERGISRWQVSEAQWGRVADAALAIPAECWKELSTHLNV